VLVQLDCDGKIEAVSLKVQACAFGQASSALMAKGASGKSLGEIAGAVDALSGWLEGTRPDPGTWPGLSTLAPARARKSRHGAILLPFRALLKAMGGTQG
jgi:NifU-like protein involved in Fe-S cluster formation